MSELVEVIVGVIGKAHGIRGDVIIDVRTDELERRFTEGARLRIENTGRHLSLTRLAWHSGRLLAHFEELPDRTAAEQARGLVLVCDVPVDELPTDEDEYYDRQLVGLVAVRPDGTTIGRVTQVVHLPGQDLLAIETDNGERLVPFVTELVPTVDLAAGELTVVDLPGLLDDQAEVAEPDPGAQQ